MRIAGKKLRYIMEIYKKAFNKRLDEALRTVRSVQTLLGDIHDCDVWIEAIEEFTQQERQRTIEYYGHEAPFGRLRPGFEFLRDERTTHRRKAFDELVRLWKNLEAQGFWDEMLADLEAAQAGARSPASAVLTIRAEEHAPETADARGDLDPGPSGRKGVGVSQTKPFVTTSERKGDLALPDLSLGPGLSQSCASADEALEAEILEPAPPPDTKMTRNLGTQRAEEPTPRGRDLQYRRASDNSVTSHTTSAAKGVCGCCGANSFLPDELRKIDSGQFLCPRCLGAFREKAGES
jgi:hypothetical protein